jgi:hypothetical protein
MEIPPDSCLKMVCVNNTTTYPEGPFNPDSVKIDSCIAEPTYYAKRFFLIYFPDNFYPFDKVIKSDEVKTTDSLRNDLSRMKNQIKQIVDSLGTIYFIRSCPGMYIYADSIFLGRDPYVAFYFDKIQNIYQVCDMFSKVDTVVELVYYQRCDALLMNTSDLDDTEIREQNNIYPNPVTDFISFEIAIPNKEKKVSIYNILGIKVFEAFYSERMDVRNLPTGTYFLNFMDKNYHFLKY